MVAFGALYCKRTCAFVHARHAHILATQHASESYACERPEGSVVSSDECVVRRSAGTEASRAMLFPALVLLRRRSTGPVWVGDAPAPVRGVSVVDECDIALECGVGSLLERL